jgi:hypothetical protein
MWAIWITVVAATLVGFYALAPTSNVLSGPPDMSAALASDMALYRNLLDSYVASHPSANGVVAQSAFIQNTNWNYAPQRWQNYVVNGIVVVYPAGGGSPLPAGFAAALLQQAQYSVEAGVVQSGQIVAAINAGSGIALPGGVPAISDGTPIWIAEVF